MNNGDRMDGWMMDRKIFDASQEIIFWFSVEDWQWFRTVPNKKNRKNGLGSKMVWGFILSMQQSTSYDKLGRN